VTDSGGWRPLQPPEQGSGAPQSKFITGPFALLARVHACSAAGDAQIAVALAGSLFFAIDPTAARWRVFLYLIFTMAPFAIVGPLIGPAIDRAKGGRRLMVILLNLGRTITAFFMIANFDSLLLFPLAFMILVLGKGYSVAKAAIVPTTARSHDELVEKNSRLAALSGIAGFIGAAPALLLQVVGGSAWVLGLATITFSMSFLFSLRLPRIAITQSPPDDIEREELRSRGILLASTATAVLRWTVGFMTFLIAFGFRGGADDVNLSGIGTAVGAAIRNALGFAVDSDAGSPAWQLGVVVAMSVMGSLAGAFAAPKIRRKTPEENMLLGGLMFSVGMALLAAYTGGVSGAALLGFSIGLAAATGKVAFDSIVQRDAPDANYGRTFARFETRFQVVWVLGAVIPVIFTIPPRVGYVVMAMATGGAAVFYFVASRTTPRPKPAPEHQAEGQEQLFDEDFHPRYPTPPARSADGDIGVSEIDAALENVDHVEPPRWTFEPEDPDEHP
jgi:hypothetical protein